MHRQRNDQDNAIEVLNMSGERMQPRRKKGYFAALFDMFRPRVEESPNYTVEEAKHDLTGDTLTDCEKPAISFVTEDGHFFDHPRSLGLHAEKIKIKRMYRIHHENCRIRWFVEDISDLVTTLPLTTSLGYRSVYSYKWITKHNGELSMRGVLGFFNHILNGVASEMTFKKDATQYKKDGYVAMMTLPTLYGNFTLSLFKNSEMEFKFTPNHTTEDEIRTQTRNNKWQDLAIFYKLAYDFIFNLFDRDNSQLTMRLDSSNFFDALWHKFDKTFHIKYYVCIRDCTLPPILDSINPEFRFNLREQKVRRRRPFEKAGSEG